VINDNGRSLASVIAEAKDELKSFIATRISMLMSELRDKTSALKSALPILIVGAVFLLTAWFLWVGALVAAIYVAFMGNAFAAAISLAIVGLFCVLVGAIAVLFGARGLSDTGLMPKRTIRVLKEDRLWISNEVRTQI